jgi:hypothetical protein
MSQFLQNLFKIRKIYHLTVAIAKINNQHTLKNLKYIEMAHPKIFK